MLKAYAVAVALSTTAPAGASTEVEAKPIDNNAQTIESTKEYLSEEITASEDSQVQKGYRRRGLIIIMP